MFDFLVKIDEWSLEEDVKLEEFVVKYGWYCWVVVGVELGCIDN